MLLPLLLLLPPLLLLLLLLLLFSVVVIATAPVLAAAAIPIDDALSISKVMFVHYCIGVFCICHVLSWLSSQPALVKVVFCVVLLYLCVVCVFVSACAELDFQRS